MSGLYYILTKVPIEVELTLCVCHLLQIANALISMSHLATTTISVKHAASLVVKRTPKLQGCVVSMDQLVRSARYVVGVRCFKAIRCSISYAVFLLTLLLFFHVSYSTKDVPT